MIGINMNTLEDLNRINKANDILNKGFHKLGVKPIYVDPSLQEEAKPSKIEDEFKPQIELLNQVTSKLKKEKTNIGKKNSKSKNLSVMTSIVIAAVLIYVCFYVYNPQTILEKVQNVITTPNLIKDPEANENLVPEQNSGEKTFVITSGIFKKQNQANKYRDELAIRLGVPLKVIKTDSFYTIQIGPNYKEHEDVLMVFDELARYSIKNLSIKMQNS